jgi:hypothetical protein
MIDIQGGLKAIAPMTTPPGGGAGLQPQGQLNLFRKSRDPKSCL